MRQSEMKHLKERILHALSLQPMSTDQIAYRYNISIGRVRTILRRIAKYDVVDKLWHLRP